MLYNVTINFEIKRKTGLLYIKKKLTQRQSDGWRDFFQHLYIQSGIKLILLILIRVIKKRGAEIKPFEIIMEFSSKF